MQTPGELVFRQCLLFQRAAFRILDIFPNSAMVQYISYCKTSFHVSSIHVPHIHLKTRYTIFPLFCSFSGTEHEILNFHSIGEATLVMVVERLIPIAQYSSPNAKEKGSKKRGV